MLGIELNRRHISQATSVPASTLNSWRAELSPFKERGTVQKSASKYSVIDLEFFFLISILRGEFDLSVKKISLFSNSLYQILKERRYLKSNSFIYIDVKKNRCVLTNDVYEGIYLDINLVDKRVNEYLKPSYSSQFSFELAEYDDNNS